MEAVLKMRRLAISSKNVMKINKKSKFLSVRLSMILPLWCIISLNTCYYSTSLTQPKTVKAKRSQGFFNPDFLILTLLVYGATLLGLSLNSVVSFHLNDGNVGN